MKINSKKEQLNFIFVQPLKIIDIFMKTSKYLNYLLIVIGCCVAIYAQAGETQDVVVLILGIIILMFGVYRISSTIPSKNKSENEDDINTRNKDV